MCNYTQLFGSKAVTRYSSACGTQSDKVILLGTHISCKLQESGLMAHLCPGNIGSQIKELSVLDIDRSYSSCPFYFCGTPVLKYPYKVIYGNINISDKACAVRNRFKLTGFFLLFFFLFFFFSHGNGSRNFCRQCSIIIFYGKTCRIFSCFSICINGIYFASGRFITEIPRVLCYLAV